MKYQLDPENTLAILIGGSAYLDFHPIRAAAKNVIRFEELLVDEEILGLKKTNVKTIIDGSSRDIRNGIFEHLEGAKEKGIKSILLYFAGHGYRRFDGRYFLAAADSQKRDINLDGSTAVPFETIKKIVRDTRIPQNIFIIDACYSGLAVQGEEAPENQFNIKGSYIITSSDSQEMSYFDTDKEYTLFTGELLQLLENGISVDEEKITLARLYQHLAVAVKKKKPQMSPQQLSSKQLIAEQFYFCNNKYFDIDRLLFKEIRNSIREGISFIHQGKIKKAQRYFYGLLNEAERELKHKKYRDEISVAIKEQIDFCLQYPKYEAIIKKSLEQQAEQKMQAIRNQLQEKEEALRKTSQQLEQATKQLSQLQLKLDKAQQVAASLKSRLPEENQKASKIEAPAKSNSTNYSKGQQPYNALGDMIEVFGGSFMMGNENETADISERPVHHVRVERFFLSKYLVTQRLWKKVMGNNPSQFTGNENLPVDSVSWDQVQVFILKLNRSTNRRFRLPSEAEWEYAARGGINHQKNQAFAGGDNLDKVGWYQSNSKQHTWPVGQLNSNALGCYDMSGNLWEWCQDVWHPTYENAPTVSRAWESQSNGRRVLREGSWFDPAVHCRVTDRNEGQEKEAFATFGFRLAEDA